MNAEPTTAEVVAALASIEMERREREKQSGVPTSCGWALGKLHQLLTRQRKSPGTKAESTALRANIAAATAAIEELRKLAQITGQRATRKGRPWHQRKSWRLSPGKSTVPQAP